MIAYSQSNVFCWLCFIGLQPPGYVHKMLADTFQPNGLATTPTGIGPGHMDNIDNASISASAQASNDGKTIVVRIANRGDIGANITLMVPGFSGSIAPTTWLLKPPTAAGSNWWPNKAAENPYFNPTLVSPKRNVAEVLQRDVSGSGTDTLLLPPFAYVVVEYARSYQETNEMRL